MKGELLHRNCGTAIVDFCSGNFPVNFDCDEVKNALFISLRKLALSPTIWRVFGWQKILTTHPSSNRYLHGNRYSISIETPHVQARQRENGACECTAFFSWHVNK